MSYCREMARIHGSFARVRNILFMTECIPPQSHVANLSDTLRSRVSGVNGFIRKPNPVSKPP